MAANKPDPKSLRDNPAAIAEYLNKALAKNDLQTILQALKFVVRAQNVMALAEVTGMRRQSLYRSFSGDTNPTIDRVLGLLAGLGVGLITQPLPKRTKPLMAKNRFADRFSCCAARGNARADTHTDAPCREDSLAGPECELFRRKKPRTIPGL